MYSTANKRIEKLIGNSGVENAKVTIIGLGGGGEIALHMLRSGIRRLDLYDFDILEEGNLVRHICGSEHIGKNKAIAVKDVLDRYAGNVSESGVTAYPQNIFDNYSEFTKSVKESSVVIVATDSDASKYFANEACVESQVPAVFVGMFENGCGGEVFSYVPGMACYECMGNYQNRNDFLDTYVKSTSKKDCSSNRDKSAMPGLGIDQSFLCAIAARKTLDSIVRGNENNKLPPVGRNWIAWSLFGIKDVLESHLSSLNYDFEKHTNCRLCG